jgi:hypothetical protein
MISACLLSAALLPALGQAQEMKPPKVLQIFREEVKPGKTAAHEKVEAGWPRAFAAAKWQTHYIAMVSVTGPSEAWFFAGYDSLAAWEQDQRNMDKNAALTAEVNVLLEKDGELLSGGSGIIAQYQDELSYRANGLKIGEMRYFLVYTYRVKPGHDEDVVQLVKIVREAHEKANIPEHWAVYKVTAGMPEGTYLIFQPMKSLAEVDAVPETHGKAFADALGEEGKKKLRELTIDASQSAVSNIFAFNPKMSYVSAEMAAADPDFWTPKPAAKMAAKAKKEEKPAAKP